jgi:tetratricopeptide (TPR) repeat protein
MRLESIDCDCPRPGLQGLGRVIHAFPFVLPGVNPEPEAHGAHQRLRTRACRHRQLDVLNRAHTPERPDWRVLSVQGAVLDQMGRHDEAQRYYATALRIAPAETSVLSNLGLSYALSKDLVRAESTLRRARRIAAQARRSRAD